MADKAKPAQKKDDLAEKLKKLEDLKRKAKQLTGRSPANTLKDAAQHHRDAMRAASKARTKAGQEIGELPPVKNPVRKSECGESLELFCLNYFPATFYLPFSDMHRAVIKKTETVIRTGGLFAQALPRGSGKTSLVRAASLWAILYGYRRYVYFIAANAKMAKRSLDAIKSFIWGCAGLLEDFPEAIFPLLELDREPRACTGQRYHGEPTLTLWSKDAVVFPTIPGSKASGAVFNVDGITSGFRGADFPHPAFGTIRPTFVIPDDPQTDRSAKSDSACEDRESLIAGAILGLAPPDVKIAAIMPCTVIRPGDLADRMLNVKNHPEWNGSRFGLVKSFPSDVERWAKYKELLVNFNPDIPDDNVRAEKAATDYYRAEREVMSLGAELTWPERFTPDCLDALQFAMNLQIRDARAFWSEYQNQPLPPKTDEASVMKPQAIAAKLNNVPHKHVPITATRLTLGIDVQKNALYYCVCAWEENFTGYVLDYGCWPEQRLPYYRYTEIQHTIAKATGIQGEEGQIFAALTQLTTELLGKEWDRGIGGKARIERCVIDAGYQADVVYQFCRQSPHAAMILPSHGKGIGAKGSPMHLWKQAADQRRGLNWFIGTAAKRARSYLMCDTNFWKSFVHARLWVAQGNPGCLSLFGNDDKIHRMFADHLTAERPVSVTVGSRTVAEWEPKPNTDNHLFDCLVYATVGASVQGIGLAGHLSTAQKPRQGRKSWATGATQR